MKRIITAAAKQHLHSEGNAYIAVNNPRLQYDVPCCYPVLPLIHGFIQSGDEVELYVITYTGNDTCTENFQIVSQLAQELCSELGASCHVTRVDIPDDDTMETHLDTFQRFINEIQPRDTLYADITFLNRCLPLVEMMVLNYGYRARDCEVGGIVYGSKDFRPEAHGMSKIYDITALFLMDNIVSYLGNSRNPDPAGAVRSILSGGAEPAEQPDWLEEDV